MKKFAALFLASVREYKPTPQKRTLLWRMPASVI